MEGFAPRLERSRSFWRWRPDRVEPVPAGAARPPAGQARAGRALLGRLGRQAAADRGHRTAAGPGRPYTVLSTVGMSGQRMPVVEQVLDDSERLRPDRAGGGHHAAQRAGGPGVPVAGHLPLERRDLVRPGPQRPVVPRAVDVPARRRSRGGAAARLARRAQRGGPSGREAWPGRSRRTCPGSPSAGIRCAGCGSSRSPNGTGSWPATAARPRWSAGSRRSAGAGWWGLRPPRGGVRGLRRLRAASFRGSLADADAGHPRGSGPDGKQLPAKRATKPHRVGMNTSSSSQTTGAATSRESSRSRMPP